MQSRFVYIQIRIFHFQIGLINFRLFIGSESVDTSPQKYINGATPPPLPPKPKLKQSTTWIGHNGWQPNETKSDTNEAQNLLAPGMKNIKAPIADRINMLSATMTDKKIPPPRTIYFDRMNSSFV